MNHELISDLPANGRQVESRTDHMTRHRALVIEVQPDLLGLILLGRMMGIAEPAEEPNHPDVVGQDQGEEAPDAPGPRGLD